MFEVLLEVVALIQGGLIARVRPFGKGKPFYKNGGRHHVQFGRARQRQGPRECQSSKDDSLLKDAPGSPTPGFANYGRGLLPHCPPRASVAERQLFDSRPTNMGVQEVRRRAWGVETHVGIRHTEPPVCGNTYRGIGFERRGIRPCTPTNIAPPFGRCSETPGAGLEDGIGGNISSTRAAWLATETPITTYELRLRERIVDYALLKYAPNGGRFRVLDNYAHNTSPGTCASVRAAQLKN